MDDLTLALCRRFAEAVVSGDHEGAESWAAAAFAHVARYTTVPDDPDAEAGGWR